MAPTADIGPDTIDSYELLKSASLVTNCARCFKLLNRRRAPLVLVAKEGSEHSLALAWCAIFCIGLVVYENVKLVTGGLMR
jgi:hypothetical protein